MAGRKFRNRQAGGVSQSHEKIVILQLDRQFARQDRPSVFVRTLSSLVSAESTHVKAYMLNIAKK